MQDIPFSLVGKTALQVGAKFVAADLCKPVEITALIEQAANILGGFDIIRQSAKMFGARQGANTVAPIVPGDDSVKSFPRKIVHDPCKQRLSGIHRIVSATRAYQEDTLSDLRSSRGHPKCAVTYSVH